MDYPSINYRNTFNTNFEIAMADGQMGVEESAAMLLSEKLKVSRRSDLASAGERLVQESETDLFDALRMIFDDQSWCSDPTIDALQRPRGCLAYEAARYKAELGHALIQDSYIIPSSNLSSGFTTW